MDQDCGRVKLAVCQDLNFEISRRNNARNLQRKVRTQKKEEQKEDGRTQVRIIENVDIFNRDCKKW